MEAAMARRVGAPDALAEHRGRGSKEGAVAESPLSHWNRPEIGAGPRLV